MSRQFRTLFVTLCAAIAAHANLGCKAPAPAVEPAPAATPARPEWVAIASINSADDSAVGSLLARRNIDCSIEGSAAYQVSVHPPDAAAALQALAGSGIRFHAR